MARACPVCASRAANSLHRMAYALFDDSTLPRATSIDACAACGCVFANSDAAEQDYLSHYRASSIYAAADLRAGGGVQPEDRQRLGAACERFASLLRPGELFIDVGAGAGGMLAEVRERCGCEVLGIDPDPACVAGLQARGWPGAVGSLDRSLAQAYAGRARVVALSHVLEHVWAPAEALETALRLLAPGGAVYIECPDREGYAECPNVPYYYFDPEHINHFARGDLERLARNCGAHTIASGRARIALAGGTPYPVCWALVAPGAGESTPVATAGDDGAPIQDYLAQQARAAREWQDATCEQLRGAGSLVIWGAGSQTQRVLAQQLVPRERVLAIADRDPAKQGRRLDGIPVLDPAAALQAHPQADVLVLAAAAARVAIRTDIAARWPERHVLDLHTSANHAAA